MSDLAEWIRGRTLGGVLGFGPGAIALVFAGRPRPALWIRLERGEGTMARAEGLPTDPDPRGNPLYALETQIRGLWVANAEVEGEGATLLRLALAREEGAAPELSLTLDAHRARLRLTLERIASGRRLYPREEVRRGVAESAKRAAGPPGPARGTVRVRVVEDAAGRAVLKAGIERDLREEFGRAFERALRVAERVLERRIEAGEEDLAAAEGSSLDRRRGETLLAHYRDVPRGASRVELPDPYAGSPAARIVIPLDPSRTPHENAARLFQRAKKGERSLDLIQRRLERSRKSLAGLVTLRRAHPNRSPKEALRLLTEFLRGAEIDLQSRGLAIRRERRTGEAPRGRPGHRPKGARESIRPRTYHTSDGWEVWVGRNNADNDRITHRLSRPHDFWFHVVGVPGSHVILRRPTRNAIPKPRTLEEAAGYAAYFSKARKLTRVPVIYTERKFVSKPRRAKPGQAVCARERELHVRPLRPNANAGSDVDREMSS